MEYDESKLDRDYLRSHCTDRFPGFERKLRSASRALVALAASLPVAGCVPFPTIGVPAYSEVSSVRVWVDESASNADAGVELPSEKHEELIEFLNGTNSFWYQYFTVPPSGDCTVVVYGRDEARLFRFSVGDGFLSYAQGDYNIRNLSRRKQAELEAILGLEAGTC